MTIEQMSALEQIDNEATHMIDELPEDFEENHLDQFNDKLLASLNAAGLTLEDYHQFVMDKFENHNYED